MSAYRPVVPPFLKQKWLTSVCVSFNFLSGKGIPTLYRESKSEPCSDLTATPAK